MGLVGGEEGREGGKDINEGRGREKREGEKLS